MTQNGITITADEGKTFVRISDGFRMGSSIQLGTDYSTGEEREDKAEYYTEEPLNDEEKAALKAQAEARNQQVNSSKKRKK